MGRKNRDLAGFQDVSSTNINNDVNGNKNDDINDNANNNVNKEEGDYLDNLLTGKKKTTPMKPTGFYLDDDVKKKIDEIGEKGGRGAKSQVANDALRFYFKHKGLM